MEHTPINKPFMPTRDTDWDAYGNAISDDKGELRDISAIIKELEEIQEHRLYLGGCGLYLSGKAVMLNEVLQYLRRIEGSNDDY
jgi:hypothetical protein